MRAAASAQARAFAPQRSFLPAAAVMPCWMFLLPRCRAAAAAAMAVPDGCTRARLRVARAPLPAPRIAAFNCWRLRAAAADFAVAPYTPARAHFRYLRTHHRYHAGSCYLSFTSYLRFTSTWDLRSPRATVLLVTFTARSLTFPLCAFTRSMPCTRAAPLRTPARRATRAPARAAPCLPRQPCVRIPPAALPASRFVTTRCAHRAPFCCRARLARAHTRRRVCRVPTPATALVRTTPRCAARTTRTRAATLLHYAHARLNSAFVRAARRAAHAHSSLSLPAQRTRAARAFNIWRHDSGHGSFTCVRFATACLLFCAFLRGTARHADRHFFSRCCVNIRCYG